MWLHLAEILLQFSVIVILVSYMQKRKNPETEKQTTTQIKVGVVLLVISALLALPDIIQGFQNGFNAVR